MTEFMFTILVMRIAQESLQMRAFDVEESVKMAIP
jgi:hypothetical protein